MGNDTTPESDQISRTGNTQISNIFSHDNDQLLPGERIISELRSNNDGAFQLTHNRIIYTRESRSSTVYSSTQIQDISSIQIFRRPRARRSAVWGIIGNIQCYRRLASYPKFHPRDHSRTGCGINFASFDSRLLVTSRRSSY